MKKSKFSGSQIIAVLKQAEADMYVCPAPPNKLATMIYALRITRNATLTLEFVCLLSDFPQTLNARLQSPMLLGALMRGVRSLRGQSLPEHMPLRNFFPLTGDIDP